MLSMVVLASKNRYCINSKFTKNPDINVEELCGGSLETESSTECTSSVLSHAITCRFRSYDKVRSVVRCLKGIIDIEDLKTVCKMKGACPYFVAREMMRKSEIIFAPYNYVIDPSIRSAMGINLKNTAVLFDEAHNILSVARDSASMTISLFQFRIEIENYSSFLNTLNDMTKKNKSALPDELKAINWSSLNYVKRRLTSILEWFLSIQATLSSHSNDSFFTLEYGSGMLLMIQQGLFQDESDINEVVLHCSEIDEWASKLVNPSGSSKKNTLQRILFGMYVRGCGGVKTLQNLCRIVGYIFRANQQNVADFRLLIEKKIVKQRKKHGYGNIKEEEEKNTSLSLICLNAGIVFRDIKRNVSSIILASGKYE